MTKTHMYKGMVTINKQQDHWNNDTDSLPSEKEQELTGRLMEKEAEINKTDKKIKDNEKQIKNIEKSKTWKYSKPLMSGLFANSKDKQSEYIRQLEDKLEQTEKELYQAKEHIHHLKLNASKLDSQQISETVHAKKNDGKLLDYIDHLVRQKKEHNANYNRTLRYAARVFMNEKPDYKNLVYSKVLKGLHSEDIPEFMIRAGLTDENSISLSPAVSFRALLNVRMRQKQLTGTLPEWRLDNKPVAYSFIEQLGLRKPWTSSETYKLAELPEKENIVIKPADGAGSRGVYLVYGFNDIVDMKRSKNVGSWEQLKDSMEQDLETGWVQHDEWSVEELILENDNTPASDIKFYCFYGKVGLILEIVRVPERKYCWWTVTGERVRTGKYDEELFKGKGVTQDEIDLANDISLKIPAPFVRIDFLRSGDRLVFGEFTPKPGNYDEFDDATDQWMGDCFTEAQGRLTNDLLLGKQFEAYNQLMKTLNY
ncbi:ATP-grasp fold amidoligase family protein [Lentibacillus juripiscarius]|uniref:ATP-grasp fold amidoligase family protein n=1 Tax=Lentibacillus juripiscarius TaxID=257446 RepID=A0ABW5V4K5_9BACI